ncbi:MAG: phosphoenolpyruvate--protein phosphotransferase, partial [Planctomycetota bacterium]
MLRLRGIAVSPGVAIGEALVVDNEGFRIPRRFLPRDAIDREIERLAEAIRETTAEIDESRRQIAEQLGNDYGSIFSAHAQMVNDPKLRGEVEELIRDRHYSAEYSVSRVLRSYAKVFQSLEGAYMAERANDVFDIEKRLLRRLLGEKREELAQVSSEVLVLARNLTPSETAAMKPEFVRGFVTETGGPGSHTAIVAEGLGIPAVVGTGAFLSEVSGGETVIIDGDEGLVILQPDEETLARYRHEASEQRSLAAKLSELSDKPCETLDGTCIQLLGNIEFPNEAALCLERGVDGIGLYRTEFLFLTGDAIPTEEEHVAAYREVVNAMDGRPVVMRTLDLGADKLPLFPQPDDERNPFLGLRSIRLALKHVEVFRQQLRAILRASVDGDVRIMFPLITTVLELRHARMVLADAMEDLEEEGIAF